ncbi:EmrB/QacA subfamily drug resistance transporter [Saccharopolyspora erythraea NRRL 2338]|nr:MFS transporter [Saccharopolyspora erythraea]EQD87554.1 major facilitator transporter [Saccharopolyspora erythraea D]PFG95246.1 EmrB/QacA subfamily drug resistance transporter [Saccharopolyspora erythraea NRRL 2338]QRK91899.1 MFS transporter [Saccharopolyspora erythraea]
MARTNEWRALDKRQRHVLMCTLTVNMLLFFDQTSVAVALSALQREFGASATRLQWTITAYLLALSVLMVAAGRLADRFGRRRMLLAGLAVFGLASAACAAAPGLDFLIGARFAQGVGGAIMQPLALAATSRDVGARHRGWAVGLLSTGGTTFLTAGPLISGALLEVASWRWLFVMNLPVVVFAFHQGRRWLLPSREPDPRPVEAGALVLLSSGLATLVVGVAQFTDWGWAALVPVLAGVLLLGLLVRYELRSPHPLVPVALMVRNRALVASLVALFAIQFAVLGNAVYLVLFLQHGLGESAFTAGLVLALAGIFTPLLSLTTGTLTDRHGPWKLVVGGLVLATAGLCWLGMLAPRAGLLALVPGLLAFSLSRPAVFTPASTGAFTTTPVERRGLASGLVTEARQLGGLFGVAVCGAVFIAVHGTDLTEPARLAGGFEAAMLLASAVTAVAALAVTAVLRKGR